MKKYLKLLIPVFANLFIAIFTMNRATAVIIFTLFAYIFGFISIKNKKELILTISAYYIISLVINIIEGFDIIRYIFAIKIFFTLAIITGYYTKRKKIFILFPLFFLLFMSFLYKDYVSLIQGRKSVIINKFPNINLYDSSLNRVTFTQKDKVYVLDFWSTSCSVCIKNFPNFEKKVFQYKNNQNVEFYSINIPVRKQNMKDNIAIVNEKYNYNFNKLYAKDFSPCDSLGFKLFPKLVIIKNGIIYYKGAVILDEDVTIHHIDTEIKRVLAIE